MRLRVIPGASTTLTSRLRCHQERNQHVYLRDFQIIRSMVCSIYSINSCFANQSQPAKRRAPPPAAGSTAPKARQSKLAKEHNISSQEETEIREAFGLFSQPMEGEKEGVIPIGDVRKAMMSVYPETTCHCDILNSI